jgi:hypothetical protein
MTVGKGEPVRVRGQRVGRVGGRYTPDGAEMATIMNLKHKKRKMATFGMTAEQSHKSAIQLKVHRLNASKSFESRSSAIQIVRLLSNF